MIHVIGVIGPIGSGKDTVADYIVQKYGYSPFAFRDVVHEVTEKDGLEPNRENMQLTARKHRDEQGEDVLSKKIIENIVASGCEKALVKEARTVGDIKPIIKHFQGEVKIIKVVAPEKLRFERMKGRQRLGDPQTREEFHKQAKREEELGYTGAFNFTDFIIFNTGTREALYKKIDEVIEKMNEKKKKRRFL